MKVPMFLDLHILASALILSQGTMSRTATEKEMKGPENNSPASFDFLLNFSIVRSSTIPVAYRIEPPSVDLPASTCPMKTRLKCSLRYLSSGSSSLIWAACSFATASASLVASLISVGDGRDRPDDSHVLLFVLAFVTGSREFSVALAALVIAPSSADVLLAAVGVGTLPRPFVCIFIS